MHVFCASTSKQKSCPIIDDYNTIMLLKLSWRTGQKLTSKPSFLVSRSSNTTSFTDITLACLEGRVPQQQ